MDKVFKGVDAQLVAPQGADNAAGNGLPHAKRVANGQNLITHLHGIGVAQHNDGQPVEPDFQHRQIGVGIGANHLGDGLAAIIQHHFDFVRTFNNVVIGQDVTTAADDHATSQTCLRLAALFTKKEFEPRVVAAWVAFGVFAGVDADHRGCSFLCSFTETANRRRCTGGARRSLDHTDSARTWDHFAQPFGLESGHYKPEGQQHGGGL